MHGGLLPMLQELPEERNGRKDMCSWIQYLFGGTDSWVHGTKRKQNS